MAKKKEQVTLEDNEDFQEFVSVPKDQFDFILYKANIELLQRVNKLIDTLWEEGKENGEQADEDFLE